MFVRSFRSTRGQRSAPLASLLAVVLAATLLAASPAPAAVGCSNPPDVLPVSQIVPGMTGSGLTTVHGGAPTSFTIEVIGTLNGAILPGHDLVIFEITGPQSFLSEAHGMFSGMSGSPIFINDRLAGAASYRFYFSDAAIGLFTPAAEMVNLVNRPTLPSTVRLTPEARRAVARAAGVPVAAAPVAATALRTPLAVSGLTGARLGELQAVLDDHGLPVDVHAAGTPSAGLNPTPLQPGAPMGAALSIGDVSFVGIGTTTYGCGTNVNVGWGHPFFFEGESSMALTDANVITVLDDPSQIYGPSVIAQPGDLRGTVVQDRFTGIVGVAGPPPQPMLVTSDFTSPDTGNSRVGTTEIYYQDEYWGPEITWSHMVTDLQVVFDQYGDGSLAMQYSISGLREDGVTPFTIENSVMWSSSYDAFEGIYKLTSAMYALRFNRFEDVTFTAVDASGLVTGDALEGRIGEIRTSSKLQPGLQSRAFVKVKTGGTVTAEVWLEPAGGGDPVPVTLELRAPRSPGLFTVRLRGGRERLYVNDRVGSFEELVAQLSGGEHGNELIATGLGPRTSALADLIVQGTGAFAVKVVR